VDWKVGALAKILARAGNAVAAARDGQLLDDDLGPDDRCSREQRERARWLASINARARRTPRR
jgi:hypothetical protein